MMDIKTKNQRYRMRHVVGRNIAVPKNVPCILYSLFQNFSEESQPVQTSLSGALI